MLIIFFQLNLFLSRLTGAPIGLTAMNLFVIDKPAILTVSNNKLDLLIDYILIDTMMFNFSLTFSYIHVFNPLFNHSLSQYGLTVSLLPFRCWGCSLLTL